MSYHNKGLDSFCLTVLIDRIASMAESRRSFSRWKSGRSLKESEATNMKRWYPLNNIPVRNPNQSWYRAGKTGVCSYNQRCHYPYTCRSVFYEGERRSWAECHHQQGKALRGLWDHTQPISEETAYDRDGRKGMGRVYRVSLKERKEPWRNRNRISG